MSRDSRIYAFLYLQIPLLREHSSPSASPPRTLGPWVLPDIGDACCYPDGTALATCYVPLEIPHRCRPSPASPLAARLSNHRSPGPPCLTPPTNHETRATGSSRSPVLSPSLVGFPRVFPPPPTPGQINIPGSEARCDAA